METESASSIDLNDSFVRCHAVMIEQLKKTAEVFRTELKAYRLAYKHPDTPKKAKALLGIALGYSILPFDIIPDFIPVLGQLDDAVLVPLLIILALGFIPPEVMQTCREKAQAEKENIT